MRHHIVFIGLSGYEYPHTRVRCYNFAEQLSQYGNFRTSVISFRDHLSNLSEVEVYEARDRQKLKMMLKGLPGMFPRRNTYFYIQKAHYNSALPYLLARLGFMNYFFDYDDYDVDLNVTFNKLSLRRLFYGAEKHEVITRNLAQNALGCVAASRSLYEFVQSINPRVEYVSTGVKIDQFNCIDRSVHQGPVRFIWTGLIWGEEILSSVIRAFKGLRAVREAGLDARMEVIGAGQMWDQMESTLGSDFSDIRSSVELTGWVHPDEMPGKLAAADVGLLPFSQDTMWVRSKSPTKLFEYMATGLPVVADAIGEVCHVIENEVSGYLADDQQAFSQYMVALAGDAELRQRIGQAARQRIETNFSIPVLVDRLARFLEMSIRHGR